MDMKFAIIKSPSNSPQEKVFGILYVKPALVSSPQMRDAAVAEFRNKLGEMPVLLAYHDPNDKAPVLRYIGPSNRQDLLTYMSQFPETSVPWKVKTV